MEPLQVRRLVELASFVTHVMKRPPKVYERKDEKLVQCLWFDHDGEPMVAIEVLNDRELTLTVWVQGFGRSMFEQATAAEGNDDLDRIIGRAAATSACWNLPKFLTIQYYDEEYGLRVERCDQQKRAA